MAIKFSGLFRKQIFFVPSEFDKFFRRNSKKNSDDCATSIVLHKLHAIFRSFSRNKNAETHGESLAKLSGKVFY